MIHMPAICLSSPTCLSFVSSNSSDRAEVRVAPLCLSLSGSSGYTLLLGVNVVRALLGEGVETGEGGTSLIAPLASLLIRVGETTLWGSSCDVKMSARQITEMALLSLFEAGA